MLRFLRALCAWLLRRTVTTYRAMPRPIRLNLRGRSLMPAHKSADLRKYIEFREATSICYLRDLVGEFVWFQPSRAMACVYSGLPGLYIPAILKVCYSLLSHVNCIPAVYRACTVQKSRLPIQLQKFRTRSCTSRVESTMLLADGVWCFYVKDQKKSIATGSKISGRYIVQKFDFKSSNPLSRKDFTSLYTAFRWTRLISDLWFLISGLWSRAFSHQFWLNSQLLSE